jgi:hypothetical protein
MKKQLNIEQVQNELRGGSAFFPGYKGSSSPTAAPDEEPKADETVPAGKKPRTEGVPPAVPRPVPRTVPPTVPLERKTKRPIRQRQPFDIYEDQYATLKEIAEAERDFVNGRGMSKMVREALDAYLKAASPAPPRKNS